MLNRIDFKGCCEKNELLDRVKRLWEELKTCPGKHLLIHSYDPLGLIYKYIYLPREPIA